VQLLLISWSGLHYSMIKQSNEVVHSQSNSQAIGIPWLCIEGGAWKASVFRQNVLPSDLGWQ